MQPRSVTIFSVSAGFAVRGYPDPATVTRERTIWPASETIRSSRICSASSTGQAVTVIDPELLTAVQTVYSTDLGLPEEWTEPHRTEFITAEAAKIQLDGGQHGRDAVGAGDHGVEPPAQRPDAEPRDQGGAAGSSPQASSPGGAEQRTLRTDRDRRERQPPPRKTPDPILDRAQVDWQLRWTNPVYQSEATEDLEALIDHLWPAPDFSGPFRIKAGYLLAARAEDGLTPPAHHKDPLTAELAQMIYSDLRTDGLPER
jgi:hypothetical protein